MFDGFKDGCVWLIRIDNPFVAVSVVRVSGETRLCVKIDRDGQSDEVVIGSCAKEMHDLGEFQMRPVIELAQKMHGVMTPDSTCTLFWVATEHVLGLEAMIRCDFKMCFKFSN